MRRVQDLFKDLFIEECACNAALYEKFRFNPEGSGIDFEYKERIIDTSGIKYFHEKNGFREDGSKTIYKL